MKLPSLILLGTVTALAGCSSSPYTPTAKKRITAGQVATVGLGTAAGYGIGDAIGGKKGALIGAGAGAVVSAVGYNLVQKHNEQEILEIQEQARREERVKIMNEWWKERAIEGKKPQASSENAPQPSTTRQVDYPAGTYNGIQYAPRSAPAPNP